MPFDKSKYPADWNAISREVRERSGGQCECQGECGLHHGRRCEERNNEPAKWAKGKVVLTVAHLDHTPMNVDRMNLKAMCNRCHLRYDSDHHQANARATREKKQGLTRLF
jgi:hypothetical protein